MRCDEYIEGHQCDLDLDHPGMHRFHTDIPPDIARAFEAILSGLERETTRLRRARRWNVYAVIACLAAAAANLITLALRTIGAL